MTNHQDQTYVPDTISSPTNVTTPPSITSLLTNDTSSINSRLARYISMSVSKPTVPKTRKDFTNVLDEIDMQMACIRHKKEMVKLWGELQCENVERFCGQEQHQLKLEMERWFQIYGHCDIQMYRSDATLAMTSAPKSPTNSSIRTALRNLSEIDMKRLRNASGGARAKKTIYKHRQSDNGATKMKLERLHASITSGCVTPPPSNMEFVKPTPHRAKTRSRLTLSERANNLMLNSSI